MSLLANFTEEQLVEIAKDMAKKHYPSKKEFNDFMCSISEEFHEQFKDKEFETGTIISHQKVNRAVNAFWEQYKTIRDGKGRDYRGNYVMMYRTPFEALELNNPQHKACVKLYTVMQYDGVLKWKDKLMDKDEIGEFLGYADTSHDSNFRRRILQPLIACGFLLKYKKDENDKRTFYKVNSDFVIKGKLKDTDDIYFVKVFQVILKNAIEQIEKEEEIRFKRYKKKKLNSAVGTLHALLPYVHYQTLHFVYNPTIDIVKSGETIQEAINREALRKNRKKHRLLSKIAMRKLAVAGSIEGMKTQDFNTHMEILKKVGILFEESSGGNSNYLMFPLLAFSQIGDGKDEYTIDVIKRFYKTWGKNRDKIIKNLGLEKIIEHLKIKELELKD